MRNRTLIALLLVLALVMTAVLTPMRLLVSDLVGTSLAGASSVTGTVWHGRIKDMTVVGAPLGSWRAGLDPLALMMGGVKLGLRQDKAGSDQKAKLLLAGRDQGVDRLTLLAPVDLTAIGLPVAGDIAFQNAAAVFRKGRCAKAGGEIRVRLTNEGPLQGSTLKGTPICRGEAWTAALTGQTPGAILNLASRVEGDGDFQLEMAVVTTDPDLIQGLMASGFTRDASGVRRTIDGRLFGPAKRLAKQGVKRT